jgi:hypothetical protein
MTFLTNILADSDDGLGKLVFGIIFFVIWGISALASWINKQKEEARRRQVREQLEIREKLEQRVSSEQLEMPARVVLPPPAPRMEPRPPKRPAPVPPMRQKPKAKKKPQPPVQRPVLIEPVMEAPTSGISLAGTSATSARIEGHSHTDPQVAPRDASTNADAASIAQWLNPRTLRSQFILTELLQKPLALRDDPADDL